MTNQAQKILKTVFGYDTFRPLQAEVIKSILDKKDTLVILPTGGGKSLCYQIPSMLFSRLTVVISPLIALMKDQVEQMQRVGVPAVMLNSALEPGAYRHNVARVKSGAARLLYVAPETLMMPRTMDMLAGTGVDCLAIDEAHCISEWGHDFRPEYRQLVQARKQFPQAVCTALTATATPRVRQDIQTTLGFKHTDTFIGSFDRQNLYLQIVPKDNPMARIRKLIKKFPDQAGIIYCATRRQVDELALILQDDGVSALPYHAGLADITRKTNQERFIRDDTRIIVATIAFGMGIDKPDVRFVIHYDMPKNIESYYQEIGRAGRDGLPADCLLLFSYADVYKIKHFIQQKAATERRMANIHLNAFLRMVEWQGCRRVPLLQYFGEAPGNEQCGRCDNCQEGEREQTDLTIFAQKFLSCVYRTGERFGAAHIINVLRGSKAQRVIQFNHQKISTYGIGRDLSKKQWQALSRQFFHQGLLIEDMDYGGFRLGPNARDVLKNKKKIWGWLDDDHTDEIDVAAPADPKKEDVPDYDRDLFQLLKEKRKKIADRDNVPPYVVFADKTLMEMAAYFPQTEAGMYQIHGVGETKLSVYGPEFLDVIQKYCRKQEISEKPKPTAKPIRKPSASVKKKRHEIIGETFSAGRTVVEIMEMFAIKRKTVIDHLYHYWCEGNPLESDNLGVHFNLSGQQTDSAFTYFEKLGIRRLKPVFDALSGEIDYPDLAELRLMFIAQNNLMATKK
jgi:ATP-dependent DNA helicase RecQ